MLFYQNTNTITFEHNYSDIIIDNSGFYRRAIRPQAANYGNCGTETYYWHQVCSDSYWTNPSDMRLKENIKDVVDGLTAVLQLRPVTYDLKREVYDDIPGTDLEVIDQDRKNRIGFLAQELQLSIPHAVKHYTSNDSYGINYDNMIPVLVKAIQEQQEIINKQGEMISKLSDRIKDL